MRVLTYYLEYNRVRVMVLYQNAYQKSGIDAMMEQLRLSVIEGEHFADDCLSSVNFRIQARCSHYLKMLDKRFEQMAIAEALG